MSVAHVMAAYAVVVTLALVILAILLIGWETCNDVSATDTDKDVRPLDS